jgi:hypothetical protein
LCCQCFRMFCLNDHSYIMGMCGDRRAWQHLKCPPERKERAVLLLPRP